MLLKRKEGRGGKHLTLCSSVVIIDEDVMARETLAVILKSKNFEVTCTSSIEQAVAALRNKNFDVVILAGKLTAQDYAPIQSLDNLSLGAVKIVITAYPSTLNAIQALPLNVDAYIVKPIDPEELLTKIHNKLDSRLRLKDLTSYKDQNKQKAINSKLEPGQFHEYLETMAGELVSFGLTANQAKIYVTLVTVENASPSKIASTCGIWREEVYRLLPNLANMGIITKKMGSPITYSAVPPESAVEYLMKLKLKKAAEDLNGLNEKKDFLTSNLKRIQATPTQKQLSVDSFPNSERLLERYVESCLSARRTIDVAPPTTVFQYARANTSSLFRALSERKVRIRLITDKTADEPNAALSISATAASFNPQLSQLVSIRFLDELPFNVAITDDSEAFFGKFNAKEAGCNIWSNFPFHVQMAKAAFEALWLQTKPLEKIQVRD